jgi:hypothetical protein
VAKVTEVKSRKVRRHNRVKLALFNLIKIADDDERFPAEIEDMTDKDRKLLEDVTIGVIRLWDALNG